MDKQIILFVVGEVLMVILSFILRSATFKVANKAIDDRKLCTGIYRLYPVEGDNAVRLAKGYISGVKIAFWFGILFIPFIFVIAVIQGTIKL